MVGADGVCRIRKNANPKKEIKFTGVRERYERANLKVGALDALIRFVRYCSGQASEKWMIHIQDADCVQVLSDSESKRDWTGTPDGCGPVLRKKMGIRTDKGRTVCLSCNTISQHSGPGPVAERSEG